MSVQLECLYRKDNILSRSEQYQALLFTDNSKLSNRAIGIGEENRTLTTWRTMSWHSWRRHTAGEEHLHVFSIFALSIKFAQLISEGNHQITS